jgi:hypothetical protein
VWANLKPLERTRSGDPSEYALVTPMNKNKKKDCCRYMPPFTNGASDSKEDAKNVRTTGEPKNNVKLKENKVWRIMWMKSHVRKKVRTLADS